MAPDKLARYPPYSLTHIYIYSEAMLRDALSGVNEGIRVGGHLIKTVRFADDQATLASSVKGLQLVMGNMQESVWEYDIR